MVTSNATRPLVLVSERLGPLTDEELRLESAGALVRSVPLWSIEQIHEQAADASFIILGAVEPFDAAALAGLPNLRGVVRRGVGVDNVDVDAATELGIVVGYVPDASVEEVSDHALALLLTLERRVVRLDRAVHDGAWQKDARRIIATRQGMRRLAELTLGIVGFGRIGRALARKAGRIYREILVADPIVTADEATAGGGRLVPLDELWGAVDHISLHAPLLPSTRHVVSDETLSRIRPGALLVNTSRGGLVDEVAAAAAIADGRLGGLALDVTEAEPLPADSPLLGVDGVLLTAHSAASSATATAELARRSVDGVAELVAGRRPPSIANPEVLRSPRLRMPELAATDSEGGR